MVGVLVVEQSTVVKECTHANCTCDYPAKLSSVLKWSRRGRFIVNVCRFLGAVGWLAGSRYAG